LLTTPDEHHGPAFTTSKVSVGATQGFKVAEHVKIGLRALHALNFIPERLEP